ncbi:MAG: hypothetical protein KME03_09865 [Aphanocapsa lilacina HA4352-LM1]|jgi:carbon dioxide concentrating mechanism protein CcmN|nr:hypothetical protein [Aphanocapsa lilacina HA4352-LM1]
MASLPPPWDANAYTSGDVTIHPGAAVASGALLRADPDSRIVIGSGACIGMGAILHAHQGTLEVGSGASLGAGVLVVGRGKIGADACVGTATTLLNPDIAPGQVVPPNSLVGQVGRSAEALPAATAQPHVVPAAPAPRDPNQALAAGLDPPVQAALPEPQQNGQPPVAGKAYLERLRLSLFPHDVSLQNPDSAPGGGT